LGQLKKAIQRAIFRPYAILASLPFLFRTPRISPPAHVAYEAWADYLSTHFNKEGMRVLELGSRVVTGANFRSRFSKADYVGFDFYPGENVDVVGDAHRLSSYFGPDERFDLIFSSAVFEHLAMPWVVAEEIARLLKVGGHVFVETHFSYVAHERPWNFFQFSEMGLRALFNRGLGFDLVDYGMSNPMSGYFSRRAASGLRFNPVRELYCHSEILCRKREDVTDFRWSTANLDDLVDGTRYPPPGSSKRSRA
jgi:SAM-dependent methyltransferase